jgi:hypothetical protein
MLQRHVRPHPHVISALPSFFLASPLTMPSPSAPHVSSSSSSARHNFLVPPCIILSLRLYGQPCAIACVCVSLCVELQYLSAGSRRHSSQRPRAQPHVWPRARRRFAASVSIARTQRLTVDRSATEHKRQGQRRNRGSFLPRLTPWSLPAAVISGAPLPSPRVTRLASNLSQSCDDREPLKLLRVLWFIQPSPDFAPQRSSCCSNSQFACSFFCATPPAPVAVAA